MNTPILFLLGAVALSALGGLVVWIASRPRPEKFGSAMDTFNRDLDALAPPNGNRSGRTHQAHTVRSQPRRVAGHAPASKPTSPQDAATSGARPKPGPRPRG